MVKATDVPWASQIIEHDQIREGDMRLIGSITIALRILQQVVVPRCREAT